MLVLRARLQRRFIGDSALRQPRFAATVEARRSHRSPRDRGDGRRACRRRSRRAPEPPVEAVARRVPRRSGREPCCTGAARGAHWRLLALVPAWDVGCAADSPAHRVQPVGGRGRVRVRVRGRIVLHDGRTGATDDVESCTDRDHARGAYAPRARAKAASAPGCATVAGRSRARVLSHRRTAHARAARVYSLNRACSMLGWPHA